MLHSTKKLCATEHKLQGVRNRTQAPCKKCATKGFHTEISRMPNDRNRTHEGARISKSRNITEAPTETCGDDKNCTCCTDTTKRTAIKISHATQYEGAPRCAQQSTRPMKGVLNRGLPYRNF